MGEANDYVGKGIAGGEVTIVPPPGSPFAADSASLVGNTCLYGATGGRLFVNGRAGIPQSLSALRTRLSVGLQSQALVTSSQSTFQPVDRLSRSASSARLLLITSPSKQLCTAESNEAGLTIADALSL